MRKGLLSLLAIIFAFTTVHAATLLHESFSQIVGNPLATTAFDANNKTAWMYTTSWGTAAPPNTIKVESGNITRTGYASTGVGNKLTLGKNTSTRYAFHNFTSQNSGSVFLAAIVNVAELRDYNSSIDNYAERSGGYLFCLGNGTLATQQTARVYTRTVMENGVAVGFKLGVGKLNEGMSDVVFDEDHVYQAGVDYLIVVEYQFIPDNDKKQDTYNDVINLYVNPSPSNHKVIASTSNIKSDIDNISLVGILEGNAQQTKVYIDELKVATDWTSLFEDGYVGSDPYVDVTPSTVNITDGFMEVGKTYSTTVTVNGAFLPEETVTLVTDRPDEVELSKNTLTKAEVENGVQVTITCCVLFLT